MESNVLELRLKASPRCVLCGAEAINAKPGCNCNAPYIYDDHPDEDVPRLIKDLIACGDRAIDKGQEFYAAAGRYLKWIKSKKPDGITWADYVRAECDLGYSRADELIRIADGKTTVDKARKEAVTRMRQLRSQSPERSGDEEEEGETTDIFGGDIVKCAMKRLVSFINSYEREMTATQRKEFRAAVVERYRTKGK